MQDVVIRALPRLETQRLILRTARVEDIPTLLKYLKENETDFAPYEPLHDPDYLTEAYWEKQIHTDQHEFQKGSSVRFVILSKTEDEILGTANFTQIARGAFQACYLGYSTGKKHQGQGLMTEALTAAIKYIFDEMNLHRIMANHLPHNQASSRVLQKLGFNVEGMARNYLRIQGRWQDHVLCSLINDNWQAT